MLNTVEKKGPKYIIYSPPFFSYVQLKHKCPSLDFIRREHATNETIIFLFLISSSPLHSNSIDALRWRERKQ